MFRTRLWIGQMMFLSFICPCCRSLSAPVMSASKNTSSFYVETTKSVTSLPPFIVLCRMTVPHPLWWFSCESHCVLCSGFQMHWGWIDFCLLREGTKKIMCLFPSRCGNTLQFYASEDNYKLDITANLAGTVCGGGIVLGPFDQVAADGSHFNYLTKTISDQIHLLVFSAAFSLMPQSSSLLC